MSESRFGVTYPGGSVDARASSTAQPGRPMVNGRPCRAQYPGVQHLRHHPKCQVHPGAPFITLESDPWQESTGNNVERQVMSTQGTVKWFNSEKGFGFIAPDEGGADVFAHYTAISASGYRSLEENQRVEFEIAQGPKGLQAENIRPL